MRDCSQRQSNLYKGKIHFPRSQFKSVLMCDDSFFHFKHSNFPGVKCQRPIMKLGDSKLEETDSIPGRSVGDFLCMIMPTKSVTLALPSKVLIDRFFGHLSTTFQYHRRNHSY